MALGMRLQRYVLREYLSALALTLGVIVSAILLVDVVEQVRTVGSRTDISIWIAVRLTFYKMPMLIEQTMPFAILISAMLAYSRLNRQTELPAMRAAGLSAWRFLAPVALAAFLIGVFTVTILNPAGAYLTAQFETSRAQLLQTDPNVSNPLTNGVWLRQGDETGQFVINARGAEESGLRLLDVKMFEYERVFTEGRGTDAFAFVRRIEAETARLQNGFWQLENVVENVPGQQPDRSEALSIPSDLDPARLLDRFASPNTIGFWRLPGFRP